MVTTALPESSHHWSIVHLRYRCHNLYYVMIHIQNTMNVHMFCNCNSYLNNQFYNSNKMSDSTFTSHNIGSISSSSSYQSLFVECISKLFSSISRSESTLLDNTILWKTWCMKSLWINKWFGYGNFCRKCRVTQDW